MSKASIWAELKTITNGNPISNRRSPIGAMREELRLAKAALRPFLQQIREFNAKLQMEETPSGFTVHFEEFTDILKLS